MFYNHLKLIFVDLFTLFCIKLHNPLHTEQKTRMVQLPATAAIEYVAACCRTRTRTKTKTGTKTKIGTITKTVLGLMPVPPKCNAYTHRLGFLCLASQRDGQTYKKREKLGLLAPRGVDPHSPNFQGMQSSTHLTYFIKHNLGPTPFYGARAEKPHFCP